MNLDGLDVISFDGDRTLWDFDAAMWLALRRTRAFLLDNGLERRDGPLSVDWLAAARDEVAALPGYRAATVGRIREASLELAVARLGGDATLAAEAYRVYMEHRFANTRLFADAADCLRRLRGDFRLALVSNGNTYPEHFGIESLFDVVVFAQDCGVRKPDPAIYARTLAELGAEADRALHVGDDPVEDVHAAASAGLSTAWLNRSGAVWTRADPPTYELGSLEELRRAAG